jgi:hypothetical protein
MTKEAILKTVHANPFRPFSLRLTDGVLLPVPHPDFIAISQGGRTAAVFQEGEDFSIVDLALVTAIETAASNAA